MNNHTSMTPWEIDALDVAREHGLQEGAARDLIILDWLSRGDAKPFYDWVLCGHQPSKHVLQALAFMLMKGDPECDFDPAKTCNPDLASALPFALVVKSDKAGRKGNVWKRTRDRQIAVAVSHYMEDGAPYDGAIATTHDWLKSIGIGVSLQTVRDAYDNRTTR